MTSLVPLGDPAGRDRWLVEHAGRAYAVFRHDGRLVVTDAACPHRRGPLIAGRIRDGAIICPWHGFTYDLATGRCRTTRRLHLATYRVVERDGELFAEIPAVRPSPLSEILRTRARRHR